MYFKISVTSLHMGRSRCKITQAELASQEGSCKEFGWGGNGESDFTNFFVNHLLISLPFRLLSHREEAQEPGQ